MKIVDSRLPSLIQLSLKTRLLLLREPLNLLSLVTRRRILFGISGVVLRLLLIVVAFCMSRGVHLFAPWLQIPAEGSGLEHIYTCNHSCYFAPLRPRRLCSSFLPSSCRPKQTLWLVRTTVANVRRRRFQRKPCR